MAIVTDIVYAIIGVERTLDCSWDEALVLTRRVDTLIRQVHKRSKSDRSQIDFVSLINYDDDHRYGYTDEPPKIAIGKGLWDMPDRSRHGPNRFQMELGDLDLPPQTDRPHPRGC